jgi:hypothetical protein
MGKSLAFTTVDILAGTRLLAQGRHTKYVAKSRAQQEQLTKSGRVAAGEVASRDIFGFE